MPGFLARCYSAVDLSPSLLELFQPAFLPTTAAPTLTRPLPPRQFSLEEVRGGGGDPTRGSGRTPAAATSPEPDTTVTLPLRRKSNSADTATAAASPPVAADDKGEPRWSGLAGVLGVWSRKTVTKMLWRL